MFENIFSGMGRILDNAILLFNMFPVWIRLVIISFFIVSFFWFLFSNAFFRTHRFGEGWSGWLR